MSARFTAPISDRAATANVTRLFRAATPEHREAGTTWYADATARIERDEEIGEALADMLEDDSLDTDTVNALADRLGVEIPEREYEVDVTITISRTIRVKAANREAAHSLATGDTSFMNASLQVDDSVTIEGDVDIEVQDDGAGYGDVNVNVADITRV